MSGEGDFWSATIAAYAPLQLPKPELTEKLLKRPPFRFIYDLVAGIDARFAAYAHIIPAEMQDSDKIDTKEKKVEYLTLLIQYVNTLMNVQLDVNPKKIVSGHEPEKTNVFLQYLAAAVGYAQQDKARKEAAAAAAAATDGKRNSAAASTQEAAAARSGLQLPSRDSLPRRKSQSTDATARRQSHVSAIEDAEKFTRKLDSYSLNLNSTEPRDIRTDSQSIIKMWNELATSKVETKPSHMPVDTLEMAINRQIETIKMVDALLEESDAVIASLETLVT